MIKQTVLPFKLETTNGLITSHAGLGLMGEFAVGLGLNKALDRYLPAPVSGAGFLAEAYGPDRGFFTATTQKLLTRPKPIADFGSIFFVDRPKLFLHSLLQ